MSRETTVWNALRAVALLCLGVLAVCAAPVPGESADAPKGLIDFRWGESLSSAGNKARAQGLHAAGESSVGDAITVQHYTGRVFGREAEVSLGFARNALFDVTVEFTRPAETDYYLFRDALEDLYGGAGYYGNYGAYGARECHWVVSEVVDNLGLLDSDNIVLQYSHRTRMNKALGEFRNDTRSERDKLKKRLDP